MTDMENRMFELKVGIFIAVGLLIFFLVVFSIGDVNLIKRGYRISAIFNFVNGITESAPVRLAGVNIGQIDKIEIFFDEKEKKTKEGKKEEAKEGKKEESKESKEKGKVEKGKGGR